MGIVMMFLLLILPTLTISMVTHNLSSYLPFQHLDVKQSIAETKLNFTKTIPLPETTETEGQNGKQRLRLRLLHRDKLMNSHSHGHGGDDHGRRFRQQMKRDVKRAKFLIRRLSYEAEAEAEAEAFGSDVVSGMEEGSGEYFARIGVGSPPTSQYVVIDSGSDVVWLQCQPCSQCYHQYDPVFNPADSASFIGVSCTSAVCSRLENYAHAAGGCNEEGRWCHYEVSYGDGSYTKGTLALETITMGRTLIRNVAIGCGHKNHGMFVGAGGLLGLGGGSMSFVGQLGGQTGGAFSYCLVSRGTTSAGSIEFGRESMPVGAAWVPLVYNPRAPSFYYVGLSGLGVGAFRVPISEDVFQLSEQGDGGVVMDTGTAVTRLPTAAYNSFRDAFIAQVANLPRASGVSIFDTCYNLSGFVSVRVPTVSFYFSGGPILTLPARNFLIPVDNGGTFCFAFAPSPSGLSIIGNIQQEGIQISVDGASGFVGFGPNIC